MSEIHILPLSSVAWFNWQVKRPLEKHSA